MRQQVKLAVERATEHRAAWGWQMGRVHAVTFSNMSLHAYLKHESGHIREVRTHLQNQKSPSIELLRNFNGKKVLSFSMPPIPYYHRAPNIDFKSAREGKITIAALNS